MHEDYESMTKAQLLIKAKEQGLKILNKQWARADDIRRLLTVKKNSQEFQKIQDEITDRSKKNHSESPPQTLRYCPCCGVDLEMIRQALDLLGKVSER